LAGGQTMIAAMKATPGMQPETDRPTWLPSAVWPVLKKSRNNIVISRHDASQDVADNADVRQQHSWLGCFGQQHWRQASARHGHHWRPPVANNDPAACYRSALLALGATCQHRSDWSIKADDFFQGLYTTALEAGEPIISPPRVSPFPPKRLTPEFDPTRLRRFALVGVSVRPNGWRRSCGHYRRRQWRVPSRRPLKPL
jgi:carbon-monoxide dehydrogenase medium subunit